MDCSEGRRNDGESGPFKKHGYVTELSDGWLIVFRQADGGACSTLSGASTSHRDRSLHRTVKDIPSIAIKPAHQERTITGSSGRASSSSKLTRSLRVSQIFPRPVKKEDKEGGRPQRELIGHIASRTEINKVCSGTGVVFQKGSTPTSP